VHVPFSYLPEQFADPEPIIARMRQVVARADFTLGAAVGEFEERFAALIGSRHAIGVNSGTDALRLTLKAAGVGPGHEVITAANTFIATVGAIADTGARTVFVDCTDDFCMDVERLEAAITSRTKAVIPVHMSGAMVDMPRVLTITERRRITVIEDACQAIKSSFDGRPAGLWGAAGAFSLHPLKFLNIWGDGGVITTDDAGLAKHLRLLRNHGLESRDVVVMLGCNSRLDTLQAIVALHVIEQADWILRQRQRNAAFYDRGLAGITRLKLSPRDPRVSHSYVTYQVLAEQRDELLQYCLERAIECKVHYPIPLYWQEGLRHLGYRPGDFPVTDSHARSTLTLPVHQYLTDDQLAFVIDTIRGFYRV
jgi:dTDP-3-amino-2,3,6-trideoxy-4-keto-D-glucose/dTDP-3-amino-3,4,6-trideoxy-alpha-D-glucose/dTDP-2,6-dideoxy-D-kanosamine transaminase